MRQVLANIITAERPPITPPAGIIMVIMPENITTTGTPKQHKNPRIS